MRCLTNWGGAEDVAIGLMDEQQVDVVGLQLAQALVNAAGGTLLAGVADPHLGDEEEMCCFFMFVF